MAAFLGVAATGVAIARAERRRRAYTPDEIRVRLRSRADEAADRTAADGAGADRAAANGAAGIRAAGTQDGGPSAAQPPGSQEGREPVPG